MQITLWPSLTSETGSQGELDWQDFLDYVRSPSVALSKEALQGWSPIRSRGNARGLKHVELVSCLVFDLDKGGLDLTFWRLFFGVAHTSFSHSTTAPKWRVVLKCSRDMSPKEYSLVWRVVRDAAVSRGVELDEKTKDASRFWYAPGHLEGAPYEVVELSGEQIDVDAFLAQASDAPSQAQAQAQAQVQEMPAISAPRDLLAPASAMLGAAWPADGQRHEATLALAGALRSEGYSEEEALEILSAVCRIAGDENRPKRAATIKATYSRGEGEHLLGWRALSKHVDPRVVEAARKILGRDASLEAKMRQRLETARARGAPKSLEEFPPTPFPVDLLPSVLRRFAEETAKQIEVPIDLPCMSILGACSTALAGKVDIEVQPGHIEGLNLFLLTGANTGERKTPVYNSAFGPIMSYEKAQADLIKPLNEQAKAHRDSLIKRLNKRQQEFSAVRKEDEHLERANGAAKPGGAGLQKDIAALILEIESVKVPVIPRLLVGDVTIEKLAVMLGEHGGRLCLASDEATFLENISGKYSNGRSSFEAVLQGYSGSQIRVDRKSAESPPVFVPRPRLVIALSVQPSVVAGLARDESMRSKGLIGRFLYALPGTMVGARPFAGYVMPASVSADYGALITRLCNLAPPLDSEDIPRISMSREAWRDWRAFNVSLEDRLKGSGDLIELVDWGSKHAGNLARLAGLLHCVEQGPKGEVSKETMERALAMSPYFVEHAKRAYGSMSFSEPEQDALYILSWMARTGRESFSVKELVQKGPRCLRGDRKRRLVALELLMERGELVEDGLRWMISA